MINKSFLKNRRILITGGTGSFGNAMTKALLSKNIKEIRIFSRDEKKQDDMRRFYNNNNKIKFYIGDIRDSESVKNAVKNIDYIFHAAALKQVPSCEFYPMEAVKTNIVGVENILNHAIDSNVKKIVCLSTDKAVYPINAMGLSKAMMEKIIIAKSRFLNSKKTKLCITRYGNVICSRGSVIPLFVDCIVNNKPLPVTDLSMTRFMMSLEDAINLVFFAFLNGNNGDILIRKSPASTIETIIDALSKILNKKITKKIIGPRHGEKYHETLMTKDERQTSKNFRDYFQISTDNRELNYEKYFSKGKKDFKECNDYTSANTRILNLKETINLLKPILKQNKI